jgi:hypothetical protein
MNAIAKKDYTVGPSRNTVWEKGESRKIISDTGTHIAVEGKDSKGFFGWVDKSEVEIVD